MQIKGTEPKRPRLHEDGGGCCLAAEAWSQGLWRDRGAVSPPMVRLENLSDPECEELRRLLDGVGEPRTDADRKALSIRQPSNQHTALPPVDGSKRSLRCSPGRVHHTI